MNPVDIILKWKKHPMRTSGREKLDKTDEFWELIYENEKELRIPEGTLLYRVHEGGLEKPELETFDDMGENYEEVFRVYYQKWEDSLAIDKIRWTNNWLSFTNTPDVIGSNYFSRKNLRGFVIVINPLKGINISEFHNGGFNEFEVVAPMDKSTLVEILEFDEFMSKYGTGNSDYEKIKNRILNE